jgi:hypothetical protein
LSHTLSGLPRIPDISEQCRHVRTRANKRHRPGYFVTSSTRPGIRDFTERDLLSVVEMGGASFASDDNRVTEAAIRGFWKAYRGYMGI